MLIEILFIVSAIQLIIYLFLETNKIGFLKILILIAVLLVYYMVLPPYFFPEISEDGINCAMPALGIILAFAFYGTIAGISSHLTWLIISVIKKDDFKK